MPVRTLFDSGQLYGGRAYRDYIASAHAHNMPIVIARRGMRWSSGDGVSLHVAMLQYRDFRELFIGDAGEASEAHH